MMSLALPLHAEPDTGKETVVRKLEPGKHDLETVVFPNLAAYVSMKFSLSNDGKVSGSLDIESERRAAACTVTGKIENHVLVFTFKDSESGAEGTGKVVAVDKDRYELRFEKIEGGNGYNAALFTKYLLKPTKSDK